MYISFSVRFRRYIIIPKHNIPRSSPNTPRNRPRNNPSNTRPNKPNLTPIIPTTKIRLNCDNRPRYMIFSRLYIRISITIPIRVVYRCQRSRSLHITLIAVYIGGCCSMDLCVWGLDLFMVMSSVDIYVRFVAAY